MKQTKKPHKPASVLGFTLVELIVVITILAILGTIGFIQLWSFAGSARDSARISNLTNLKKGLDLFQIKSGSYPMPESSVAITASGVTIGYQGFAKDQVAWLAKLSPGGTVDPSDSTMYITYTVNQKQSKMQAMVFLEDASTVTAFIPNTSSFWITQASASVSSDYSTRYPTTIGDGLGILLSNTGTNIGKPAQEIASIIASGSVDIQRTTDEYKAYFSKSDAISGTGTKLQSLQLSYNYGAGYNAPSSCPTGFIPVPGNKDDFKQPGFCVAKYEMSYADADTPDSGTTAGTKDGTDVTQDWNTMNYNSTKTVVSMAGKCPIANITQAHAIEECRKIGAHLITNNEWMTIARNIEQQPDSWSGWVAGVGGLYRGITGEGANTSTSLGCNTADSTGASGLPGRNYVAKPLSTDTTKFWVNKTDCDSKRQLKLSNGQVIWDLAGNVWEHVNRNNTLDGGGDITTLNKAFVGPTTYTTPVDWIELNVITSSYFTNNILPKNTTLLKANGIGALWFYDGTVFVRGGTAVYGAYAGVFTLDLSWSAGNANRSVGFRCAQ